MSKDITMQPPGTPVPPDFKLESDRVLPAPDDLRQPPQSPEDVWIVHAIRGQRAHLLGQTFRDDAQAQAHHVDHYFERHGCDEGQPAVPPIRDGLIGRLKEGETPSVELYTSLRGMWSNGCGQDDRPRDLIDRQRLETNWPQSQGDRQFRWTTLTNLRRSVYLGEDTTNWLSWLTVEGGQAINCACWENNALVVAADAPQPDAPAIRAYDPREPGLTKQEAVITGYRILPGPDGQSPAQHLHHVFTRILRIDRQIHAGDAPFSAESRLPELPVDYQVWLPNLRKTVWVNQRVLRRQFGRGYGLTDLTPQP